MGLGRWLRSESGTMALTLSQLYLGALTLGLGLGRGIEADLLFTVEDMLGEANYAASRVGAGHGRSANAIADNNVLSVAAMAPRLAVEADNVVMDLNAAIACSNSATPGVAPVMAEICAAYAAGKPRALAKLAWIRQQQTSMWSSLEHLSGSMDKIAGLHAQEEIGTTMAGLDPSAKLKFSDPTLSKDIWSGRNATTGCSLASKDALLSPMTGHAFPLLMPNMLVGLPQALVAGLPALCPSAGMPGMPSLPKPMKLPEVPEVSEKADKRCNDSQMHMRDQVAHASSSRKAQKVVADDSEAPETERPTMSSDVDAYVKCTVLAPGTAAPKKNPGETAFTMRRGNALYTCTFDRDECREKALEEETAAFLKSMGLPSIPSFGMLGGSTRAPGAINPNVSDDFRASATVQRAVDSRTTQLAENLRYVMSFGQVQTPSELRNDIERSSTAKWYFPSGAGPFAATPPEQRGFVRAYRHALVYGGPAR